MKLRSVKPSIRPDIPRDIRGRGRADRSMLVLGTLLETYLRDASTVPYDPSVAGHNPNRSLNLVVESRTVVAHDDNVVSLTLASPDGSLLPPWYPGAHLDLHLPSGRRRQYSLCGEPGNLSSYRIAVRKIPQGGGGSLEIHNLEPGAALTVSGPRNAFPFVGQGSALFIAGGIGITPILPMVRAARRLGMDWQFVYSGRSHESMPFLDEISTWEQDRILVRTDVEFGLPAPGELLERSVAGGAVYCCGPTPMLDSVRRDFAASAATALHFERFGPPPVKNGRPFQVQLVSTGQVIDVPADVSTLAAIKASRPDIAYSCQQGFCGTCKVKVLAGTPDHRETQLSPTERESHMLTCVSRADGGRLVLDL